MKLPPGCQLQQLGASGPALHIALDDGVQENPGDFCAFTKSSALIHPERS